jgi:hypothetical protein
MLLISNQATTQVQISVLSLFLGYWMLILVLSWLLNVEGDQYCDPGGNFNINGSDDQWVPKHFFQITVGFGDITFSQAKVIDICWDIVVARGGQGLLGLISYKIFTKALTYALEDPQVSVSYRTYTALVFNEPSLTSVLKLSIEYFKNTSRSIRAVVLWIIFSSLYLCSFPTLASAMTGYSSNTSPYLKISDGSQVPWVLPHRLTYIIHDGCRIPTLTDSYIIGLSGYGNANGDGIDQDYVKCLEFAWPWDDLNSAPDLCKIAMEVSNCGLYTLQFDNEL